MKRYCIKCQTDRTEYFDIISEDEAGYTIRLTRISHGYEKTIEEIMSRDLFDSCLNTGYIYEMETAAANAA